MHATVGYVLNCSFWLYRYRADVFSEDEDSDDDSDDEDDYDSEEEEYSDDG